MSCGHRRVGAPRPGGPVRTEDFTRTFSLFNGRLADGFGSAEMPFSGPMELSSFAVLGRVSAGFVIRWDVLRFSFTLRMGC